MLLQHVQLLHILQSRKLVVVVVVARGGKKASGGTSAVLSSQLTRTKAKPIRVVMDGETRGGTSNYLA